MEVKKGDIVCVHACVCACVLACVLACVCSKTHLHAVERSVGMCLNSVYTLIVVLPVHF